MARTKKKKDTKISKVAYYIFYFFGSFFVFVITHFFYFICGRHEEIIYTAKQFRKRHKPKTFKVHVNFLRILNVQTKVKILFFFLFILILFSFGIWFFIFRGLPSPDDLVNRRIDVSTRIYDRNGVLLYQIYKDKNRTLIGFDKIPTSMKLATLASEDAGFYQNPGFSIKGIVRALIANIANKDTTVGGSTITQQLVKNVLLSPEKTLTRKIKELVLSVQVEQKFSKDKILEMYLNEVGYGGSAYGIEAASEQYFGTSAEKLDLSQAALLAGLPQSPTTYSPFGTHPELSRVRQRQVLELMAAHGFITNQEKESAENEKLNFVDNQINIKAPHFVMYVRQKLVDEYGEEIVASGGLNVMTTLDINIQKMAEEVVKTQVEKIKNLHVGNGAALIVEPTTGEILAMVGSKDYFDSANDGMVNVTTALRPPGSSIKIVNYAYALSHGYTPASVLLDTPVSFKFSGSPIYTPVNYDGKFFGPITLRNAFAQSRNIPAVKVLASYGVENMIQMGQAMGITTWNEKNTYGLSLTLGGGSTRLIDLAQVYATVANFGKRPAIYSIKKITDYNEKNLPFGCDSESCDTPQILDARVAYQIISILSDNQARAREFGLYSSLVVKDHPEVVAKTGTSNDLRDNLTLGFNQKYLTAVWVGNNDNSPMSRIASGITGAAPIWNEIMNKLLKEPSEAWKVPEGMILAPCPVKPEWFLKETDTKKVCDQIKYATASAYFVSN